MTECRFVPATPESPDTLYLREYETCICDQLSIEQAQALQTYFSSYVGISRTLQGQIELSARQYVGIIVLRDLRLIIEPKVSMQNLFYMLTYAHDLHGFRDEMTELVTGADLFEFIVVIFLRQVEQLIRRGVYRTYVSEEKNHTFLQGRLVIADHLRRNAVHAQRFYQRNNEFTTDVLENRILTYTLWLLSRLDFRQSALRRQVRRVLDVFGEVSLVPILPVDCDRVVYTRLNSAYRTRINLARLLLQHLSLEGQSGPTEFATYLFDMNQVFEVFVARYLAHVLENDTQLEVAIKPQIWLDENRKEKSIPDIILHRRGKPYQVLDTKYKVFKDRPAKGDLYQMVTYCHALGVPRGTLIYANDESIEYDARIRGITLGALALPLHGSLTAFETRCRQFADDFIFGIKSSSSWKLD